MDSFVYCLAYFDFRLDARPSRVLAHFLFFVMMVQTIVLYQVEIQEVMHVLVRLSVVRRLFHSR